MKHLLITGSFVSLILLNLSGCRPEAETNPTPEATVKETTETLSTADLTTNDFTPPEDFEWGWENDGPYEMRLLSARSEDGITWERDNQIISNQANVPNMLVTEDGTVYLYYTGGNILGKDQAMAAAVSQDRGESWTYKAVTITGGEIAGTPGDPDVVLLEDGSFRMYFTSQLKTNKTPGIYYADSTDGLNFIYGGEALQMDDYMIMDSSTFTWNGQWFMLTLDGFDAAHIFASSDDGKTFTFLEKVPMKGGSEINYFLSNEVIANDGILRMYGFDLSKEGEIRSSTSTDGLTWIDEGLVHLELDTSTGLEGHYLKDPAVVQLNDGSYLMVYVTRVMQP